MTTNEYKLAKIKMILESVDTDSEAVMHIAEVIYEKEGEDD